MSNVVTIGAVISAVRCVAVAIGFSLCEREGTAAKATDAAQSRGRTRRLSKVVNAVNHYGRGPNTYSREAQLIDTRTTGQHRSHGLTSYESSTCMSSKFSASLRNEVISSL